MDTWVIGRSAAPRATATTARLLVVLALAAASILPAFVAAPGAAARSAQVPRGEAVGGRLLGAPGLVVYPTRSVPRPPAVTAASYVVADLGTGEVLAAKGAHTRLLPASTLKVLTALALHDELPPTMLHRVTNAEAGVEGSRVGLVPGGNYSVAQLMQGMLMASGNDAATALANAAGGVPRAAASMNTVARELGAFDTVAVNPSGLDAPGQMSSAYDLALIARAALAEPDLRSYLTTLRTVFPGNRAQRKRSYEVWNHNRFLTRYPGAIGVKNGYTVRARHTQIAAATRGGRTLVVTLLGSEQRAWREAMPLMDWGFLATGRVRPVGRLVEPGEVQVAAAAPVPAAPATAPAAAPAAPATAPATAAAAATALPQPAAEPATTPSPTSGASQVAVAMAALALLPLVALALRRRTAARRRASQQRAAIRERALR